MMTPKLQSSLISCKACDDCYQKVDPGDQRLRNGHQVTIMQPPDSSGFVLYRFNHSGETRRCPVEQLVAMKQEPIT
jgi:hypothetical protein